MKKLREALLKYLAKVYLWRTKPDIVVVAGTTGRYWVKEAIAQALIWKGIEVRTNRKNFNAELGLPLSIMGLDSLAGSLINYNSFSRWRKIFSGALLQAFGPKSKMLNSKCLILEMAVDRPRNMSHLLEIIKPKVAVFTTVTMIYQENFESLDKIANEYRRLVEALPADGMAILNGDDERVVNLETFANARSVKYGFDRNADFRADKVKKNMDGQSFEINCKSGDIKQVKINRFGQHHIYAQLAAEIVCNYLVDKK